MIGRLSQGLAVQGKRDEAVRLYQELDETLRSHDGYVASCVFTDPANPLQVGRFSFWRDLDAIDRAAGTAHVIALRSRIHLLLQPGHTESVIEIVSTVNLP